MLLETTYEKEFESLMQNLRGKYPEELFDLEGIGKQLDMSLFSKNFFRNTSSVADVSVDSNANVDDSSIIAYNVELPKAFFRLNSLYLIWKYLKKLYDIETANKAVEMQICGDIYINDLVGINAPYCYNFSTYDIAISGLPFVNKVKSNPPKHLSSFIGQLIHFTVYASNSVLGAVGLADFLIVTSYYVDKLFRDNPDVPEEYLWRQVKQELQSFIFSCNQPFRSGIQSGFYNISLYDKYFLNDLCGNYYFPDGIGINKNTVNRLQELYVDLMNETLRYTPITFPVTTACFSIDENKNIKDKEFLSFIAGKNIEFGFINMYFGETSTLSSCCFDAKQCVLVKDSNYGVSLVTFKELDEMKNLNNFTVFHNGSWKRAKKVKLPKKQMYKIITQNNKKLYVTEDHIHVTLEGDKCTSQLTKNDYLMFNVLALDSYPEKDENFSYEVGILLGAYLGDGSCYKRKDSESYEVTYSFNKEKVDILLPLIKKGLQDLGIIEEVRLYESKNNVYFLKVFSKNLYDFIKKYVKGNYCYEKEIDVNVLLQSKEFRKGIIDGIYMTDGGNSNRIYTTSERLVYQLEAIFTSLGIPTVINVSDRTDEKCIIRNEEFDRNYPLYCIRWYDFKNKRSMGDIYRVKNNSAFFKIKDIQKIESSDDYVYCFEMVTEEEPYFTLPNGVITHNCRLRNNMKTEYFNQLGAGGTKIGSLGVVTLNIPRIAIKSQKDRDAFFSLLKDTTMIAIKINNVKRHLLRKRIDSNNLPLYKLGFMDLKTQYSTVGLVGINEACNFMGLNILNKDGQEFVSKILDVVNELNDKATKQYNAPHNVEQVPAENSAIKLAQKDKLLNYQDEYALYSNQFIPLTTNANLLDRIAIQGMFDEKMTGGAICHLNVEQRIENPKLIEDLMITAAKAGVVYTAINYNLQKCQNEHMSVGKNSKCPICGAKITDNFTRVVGFLVNTKNFHKVRREYDYPNRVFVKELKL